MKPLRLLLMSVLLASACGRGADRSADTAAPSGDTAIGRTASGQPVGQGLADPNTASREQLASIPGLDAATITALVNGRPYADMVAVDKTLASMVTDQERRKAIYARLWKPIDLNTASGEEILLIPGIGPRMKHEFEEYRPYRSIEEFRREIGKYVDRNEVARLERYVSVR